MIIWICILIAVIGLSIGLFIIAEHRNSVACGIGGVMFAVIALIIILHMIVTPLTYRHFEGRHEIQREYYINFLESNNEDIPIHLYADIFEINNELTEYQALKNIYGKASLRPDRVMDLKPILIK